ncbi:uncharacterized protein [Amphiura filiformis]|uniref:uncharacterized protein n=1 Tax=Amphiura filiformis TaxID=82378 RepID=UPI003B2207E1
MFSSPQPQLMSPMDFGAPPLGHQHMPPHFDEWNRPPPFHHPRLQPHCDEWNGPPPLTHPHLQPHFDEWNRPPPPHHYGPPPLVSQYRPPPPTAHHYGPPRPLLTPQFGPGPHHPPPSQYHYGAPQPPPPPVFQNSGRNSANHQRQADTRPSLIKPQPIRPKPFAPPKKREHLELAKESVEVYRQIKEILLEVQGPLKVTDPELMDLFMDLPESLKHSINHKGGYRVFLQQSNDIEVKDGWVQIKQTEVSVECKDEVGNKNRKTVRKCYAQIQPMKVSSFS